MKANRRQHVSLVTSLDELGDEWAAEPMWMVRPKMHRKYPSQRITTTVEIVELASINLARMHAFETL